MKKFISLLSVVVILTAVVSLAACGDNKPADEPDTTFTEKKSVTSEPVKISELPESTEDKLDMFNSALDYFDIYCMKYKKRVKCEVSGVNVGSLSAASNAVDAFKSVFGETDITTEFDFNKAPESFTANIIDGGFDKNDVSSAEAKQDRQNIVLTVTFPNESNPDAQDGILKRLSGEYIGAEKVKKNLGDFASSAGSVSVLASDITVTVTISAVDSSVQKLTVSYIESFSLGNVKLVELEGSVVTGKSKTVITYSNMK